jgi:PAS domain S-box-containing protein
MTSQAELLRRSLDTLEDVFYIYDADGRLAVWNDRLNELFDLTDEELTGTTPVEFFLESDRPAVERAVAEMFETGEAVVEARAVTTEGTIRFELSAHRLTDDDGEVRGFCGVGRDVTEHREQQRKLAVQNDRLEKFASVLAHDVRNPLAVATGYVDLCIEREETAELDRVSRALDRIDRIVEDVLVIAIEGQAATDSDPVEIRAVAGEAWEMVETGEAVLDVTTDLVVSGDADRIRRLFENLSRNAVEHAGTGAIVTVTETTAGFAVADDGPGVPAAERERVFDPAISTADHGTGFGLYIVRTIAESYGWTVALAESEGGGARFEFTLVPDADPDDDLSS